MPLRAGHALVIPKVHIPRVSELPDEFAAECGKVVSRVARAIATGAFELHPTSVPLYVSTR